jgi:hypothetical protein
LSKQGWKERFDAGPKHGNRSDVVSGAIEKLHIVPQGGGLLELGAGEEQL